MADRTFDYDVAKQTYQSMQKTTEAIAEALNACNEAVDKYVQVEDEAIFGDLGSQLKTDWENSASCFPSFVNRFGNWAALVAQSSGNYAEFEEQVKGFNPDGTANASNGGAQQLTVANSFYNNYYTDHYDEYLNNGGTGAVDASIVIPGVPAPEDTNTGAIEGTPAASDGDTTDTGETPENGDTADDGETPEAGDTAEN